MELCLVGDLDSERDLERDRDDLELDALDDDLVTPRPFATTGFFFFDALGFSILRK